MFEKEFLDRKYKFIAATDEVGRGPLAGPVVSACVKTRATPKKLEKLTTYLRELGVTDSKKLTDKKRVKILEQLLIELDDAGTWQGKIAGVELRVAVDEKSAQEIDELNILQASLCSMRDAFLSLYEEGNAIVLVDGNKKFQEVKDVEIIPVVKGDSKSALIGLASIVAKVYRDRMMEEFALDYPHYDFEKNAGYPTARHREAIVNHGITPIHRKTFKGVKEYVCEQLQ
jgi:ribonuclease HII